MIYFGKTQVTINALLNASLKIPQLIENFDTFLYVFIHLPCNYSPRRKMQFFQRTATVHTDFN